MWMIWKLLPVLVIHGDDLLMRDGIYLDSVMAIGLGTKELS